MGECYFIEYLCCFFHEESGFADVPFDFSSPRMRYVSTLHEYVVDELVLVVVY